MIGALHGWLTNYIALRLLFKPEREVKVFGLTFQGVLHRRKEELAIAIGDIVESELLRLDDIKAHLAHDDTLDVMAAAISRAAAAHVSSRLPKVLPPQFRQIVVNLLESLLSKELVPLIEGFLEGSDADLILKGRVAPIVTERIRRFNVGELEAVVKRAVGKEMRWIERLGFIMGLAIGLIQGLFLLLLRMAALY